VTCPLATTPRTFSDSIQELELNKIETGIFLEMKKIIGNKREKNTANGSPYALESKDNNCKIIFQFIQHDP